MGKPSFTAIDFETANERRDSACQLAAVCVRDGEIAATHNWFLRPKPLEFRASHMAIHGITPLEVVNCPDFQASWPEISCVLAGQVLVAHNAIFDVGVLRACMHSAAIEQMHWSFACTCLISRRTWPGEVGYGLKPVANRLGICFKHHDALEDAMACAGILLAACEIVDVESLEELERKLGLIRGISTQYGVRGPATIRYRSAAGRNYRSHHPARFSHEKIRWISEQMRDVRPLADQQIVFTGLFDSLDRDGAEKFASELGGLVQQRVTRSTSIIVVGRLDRRTLRTGNSKSTKEHLADELAAAGGGIRKLTEMEFLQSILSQCPTVA